LTRQSQRAQVPSRAIREVLEGRAEGYVPGGMPETLPEVSSQGESPEERTNDDEDNAEVEASISTTGIDEENLGYALVAEISETEALEPRTLVEARSRSDWLLWERAILEELTTLREAGTWILEEPPLGVNIVGSKWVFKAKKDAAGKVVRYKARLVVQGYSQVPGVDYFDTFAPVAKLPSIRMVLAIVNSRKMELHQVDIKGHTLMAT